MKLVDVERISKVGRYSQYTAAALAVVLVILVFWAWESLPGGHELIFVILGIVFVMIYLTIKALSLKVDALIRELSRVQLDKLD